MDSDLREIYYTDVRAVLLNILYKNMIGILKLANQYASF